MSNDPILRLAKLRVIKASADLEVQLSTKQGAAPTIDILRRLRNNAATSLMQIAFLNIDDPKGRLTYVTLQNEIKRYDEWVDWMADIIHEGKAFDQEFSAEERDEILDLLTRTPEGQQEAVALGLADNIPQE